jgi:GNAT superfamily N-acetyltransferase
MTLTPDHGSLHFHQDYFGDPARWAALAALLHDTFEIDVGLQMQFLGPDPSSMPFGYFDEAGRCVANFSAFSMPLLIGGRVIKAAGYQSGAVRPEWRGQGLYRDLMQRAFARTRAEGYELDILLTDKPALYEPYGFRTLPQHAFAGRPPAGGTHVPTRRRLSLEDRKDMTVLHRLLESRTPVSGRFAVIRQMEMFHLNACFDPSIVLSLIGQSHIVAWKSDGTTFRLLDVIGETIPSIADILAALDLKPEHVEVCFPPDRLDWPGMPEPYDGYCALMVRGDATGHIDGPFMLSPMAEF